MPSTLTMSPLENCAHFNTLPQSKLQVSLTVKTEMKTVTEPGALLCAATDQQLQLCASQESCSVKVVLNRAEHLGQHICMLLLRAHCLH